jgi:hypothetical protein
VKREIGTGRAREAESVLSWRLLMPRPAKLCFCAVLIAALQPATPVSLAREDHDASFWKAIKDHNFAVPPHESAGALALEIADLAASTDPIVRDECGYEILASWIYRDQLFAGDQLEALRRKLIPGMIFQIGEAESDTIFRRSFSALYMSILAAQDLRKPFLSATAFKETLNTALRCYAEEKDLRGYIAVKGWAHATAHVADLLKFLARNPHLSAKDQNRIVSSISQRCRTAHLVFTWGEDARMGDALLSVVDRKDFDASPFETWFQTLVTENKELWKSPAIDAEAYASVRTQANVLAHLAAKSAPRKDNIAQSRFLDALQATLSKVD